MELNTSRIFSPRLVYDESQKGRFQVKNSFWDWCLRLISWIASPKSYKEENQKSVACFKKYLVDTLGEAQLKRICTRYSIDLDQMYKKGSSITSRLVAQIVTGAATLHVEDLGAGNVKGLDCLAFSKLLKGKQNKLDAAWKVPKIGGTLTSRPTEFFARLFFDPFLADRERLQISEHFPQDLFKTFMHDMCARVIKKEMDIGMILPAPNRKKDGCAQFYYVSAKLVTGEGMVCYLFHPAGSDSDLKPIRLFRGTSPRNGEIDAISSIITDMETDFGASAFKSGEKYEAKILECLVQPAVEGGHSLGSSLVQWRLANMDHIKEAYLFNGPGIPAEQVTKFNKKKNNSVRLVIHQHKGDRARNLGSVHVGYEAPENVDIEYVRHADPSKHPHSEVLGRKKKGFGIEGLSQKQLNKELDNRAKPEELLRAYVGPPIARTLRAVRRGVRHLCSTRTEAQKGLQIGKIHDGIWQVERLTH